MRITGVDAKLLHVPLARPRASKSESQAGRLNHVVVLLTEVQTDAGLLGLGYAYALQGSGRAMLATCIDDLVPLVLGEDPLDHERLGAKVYWRTQTIGRRGLVQQAWSALDVALWDLKGKAGNLPLYKILGGARESAEVYASDSAWLWMTPEQIVDASRPYIEQGLAGIKMKVGTGDPEEDADRLSRVREALGEDIWFGIDANQRYDLGTALAMGRFFEEEIGADWFEEPISCEDVEGHARLAERLEIPIACGEMLFGRDEFEQYLQRGAMDVVQPDVTRLGGLTGFLKVAALAELRHRPVAPHLMPELCVHLACGLPQVTIVEYMPWQYPIFANPPSFRDGRLVPPPGPGLGLELNIQAIEKYRVG